MKSLKSIMPAAAAALVIGAIAPAFAQTSPPPGKSLAASAGVLAYPAKNQTPEQQTKDEAECYNWSKQQSGYDPMAPAPPAPAQASATEQPAATGARAKGAVRGAAAGAVIGEVADNDAGKGAAVGATVGVLAGGRQARQAKAQQEQQAKVQADAGAEQAKAAQQKLADSFKSGMSVCLEARGYSVK
jgi:outer membrane protein with glycine zipper